MGTDIHGVFQRRNQSTQKWEDIESKFKFDRHYLLFAWLADVRNGFGFAGVPTFTTIEPVAPQRGLPADFELDGDVHPCAMEIVPEWKRRYMSEDEAPEIWMGDHSFSWLTADEMLSHERPKILRTGIISVDEFKAWDGKTAPNSWSGGISGPGIKVADSPSEVNDSTTHVRIEWFEETADSLSYFIDEVKRLKDEHGEVRFVFGFDS